MRICIAIICFGLLLNTQVFAQNTDQTNTTNFVLSNQCPPSFEKTSAGVCELRNMYQFYNSVQGRGLGGTQTSLPKYRDGFTPQQIDLGRYLFFDPALSKDNSLSCASCHQPDKGFSDDLDRSIGITGEKVARSAPTLWNVAFLDKFFWDARSDTLEEQALGPLFDPNEMGNSPEHLLQTLSSIEQYNKMFKVAFPKSEAISIDDISTALTAFQTSLISLNSRYDQYAHGYHKALSENEIKGLNIFRSFVARCAECHQPPLFTNNQIAVIGTPDPEGMPFDVGAEKTYNNKKNRGGFKVPTLRNIAKTAPYMHSGGMKNLREATEFYNKGRGHAIPEGEDLLIHWHIWEPDLQDVEIDLIVEFLQTLTDESLTPQLPTKLPSGLAVIDENYATENAKKNMQKSLKQQNNYNNTVSGEEDE